MPWVYVTVRLHDAVVEDRLCAVTDELWLGELPEATIAFPGARVLVRRHGDRLQVQGHWLDVGRALRMRKGAVDVRLEAVSPRPMPRPWSVLPDVRLFVATAAMVLLGAWFESALRFAESNPVAVQQLQALLRPVGVVERVTTARPTTTLPVQVLDETPPSDDPPDASAPAPIVPADEWPAAVYVTLD